MTRILILGGTAEAVEIARRAAALPGADVLYSLAGRTRAPSLPGCALRVGGFGGAAGLARFLADEAVALVIDATHPYATRMAGNARAACERAGIARLKFLRPVWEEPAGAVWLDAATAAEAASLVEGRFGRVFLSIGTKELAAFSRLANCWFLVRTVDAPEAPLSLPACHTVQARGPFRIEDETALLREHRIDALVTRNSGGSATAAKLHAAAALAIATVMIARPPVPPGVCYASVDDILMALRERLAPGDPGAGMV